MAKQQESYIFSGMQRDVSVSKHPTQFMYDGMNIRLTARDGDTLLSVTNERGTSPTSIKVEGTYLGHCLLNQYLVVFSTLLEGSSDSDQTDYITRINLSSLVAVQLYAGKKSEEKGLGFSTSFPIKAIGSYETEAIQKVYWTDGKNQPRIINISPESDVDISTYTASSFDFIPDLTLKEEVKVKKLLGASGEFAPGVIQYAFTYYNKYGQETNIFYTTPLYYISYTDRGGSPEDKIENAFKITVSNIDKRFDYLRIYSIQRTSINATPFCKRIQDINLKDLGILATSVSYTDTGLTGNTVDPTELLYKGGESIVAQTLEQKDNTLFLGNVEITRPPIEEDADTIRAAVSISPSWRNIYPTAISTKNYVYYNQLTSFDDRGNSTPCSGFKQGDYYRLGIQFQYKTGKWGSPIWIGDYEQKNCPSENISGSACSVSLPNFVGSIDASKAAKLMSSKGYIKVRPLVVFPGVQDRVTLCQGVVNPTLYTTQHAQTDGDLHAQSDWFFRPSISPSTFASDDFTNDNPASGGSAFRPTGFSRSNYADNMLPYANRYVMTPGIYKPDSSRALPSEYINNIKHVEVQGAYNSEHKYRINPSILTLHSPDIQFNDVLAVTDFSNTFFRKAGVTSIEKTFSDIDIQTETPTISNSGSGFIHKSFTKDGMYGIVSGLFYDDFAVDDSEDFEKYSHQNSSYKWMVYLWNKSGSLNNDINRPADKGVATAQLKKKVISNLRFASTTLSRDTSFYDFEGIPQLFNSDEATILKIGDKIYQGNVDTMVTPDHGDGMYFAFASGDYNTKDVNTEFSSKVHWKTHSLSEDETKSGGLWRYENLVWNVKDRAISDDYVDLVIKKGGVRIKYKSSPHIACQLPSSFAPSNLWDSLNDNQLPVVEVVRKFSQDELTNSLFGGQTQDAFKENTWIPCGEPVRLDGTGSINIYFNYGDTYFQRYDCLKTYPFTKEDLNQVVEIGSFMLESHINIDGRYDRNRGQLNNLNMSPQNFNLLNPVYSQQDNFFTYKIMDKDFYSNSKFPHQVTWTKEKSAGADVDLWTNITLASTYDMDGSKGGIEELVTYKDQIYCFQNRGVSNILFNSRVQIPTSDGVPIEISNSYKVDGYRYLSDGIGCDDKRLIKKTPAGIYFVDSIGNHLMHVSEQGLKDLAEQCNMTTWFRDNAGSIKKVVYDDIDHDVYAVQEDQALCFSEKLNQFTGLYSYGHIDLIETCDHHVFTLRDKALYKMFEGEYGHFFDTNKPWHLTFISNGSGSNAFGLDKTFTNLEFRACVSGEGTIGGKIVGVDSFDSSFDASFHPVPTSGGFAPYLPFDYMETWNEYQHGKATLSIKNGHEQFKHHLSDSSAHVARKFRIWRCDIPRDNYPLTDGKDIDPKRNIARYYRKPNNRMRNPWLFIHLKKEAAEEGQYLHKTELHDLLVTYFG